MRMTTFMNLGPTVKPLERILARRDQDLTGKFADSRVVHTSGLLEVRARRYGYANDLGGCGKTIGSRRAWWQDVRDAA
jgi:hypothetical protein